MTRRLAFWLTAHAALAAVTLLVFLPQRSRGLMLYDLGEVTLFVDMLRRGSVPGLDFVVPGYGPGRYALFTWLTGIIDFPDLSVYGGVFVALRVLISALALEVGLRLLPGTRRPWILLPLLLLLLAPGPLHEGFYLAGSLALTLALLAYLDQPSRSRALAYGLVLPAVALFRLDLGAFGALAFALAALGDRRRLPHLLLAGLPLLVGISLALISLDGQGSGAVAAVLSQVSDDALQNQTIAYPSFPGPIELLLSPTLDRALLWLPLFVHGALLLALLRTARWGFHVDPADRRKLAVVLLLGAMTCIQLSMKPDFGHLLQAGPLLWIGLAVLLSRLAQGWPPRRSGDGALPPPPAARPGGVVLALFIAVTVVGLLGFNIASTHRGSIHTGSWTIPEERTFVLDTVLGRVWLNEGEFRELAPMLAHLRSVAPAGALWVPTLQPLLYALTERRDVTGHVGAVYCADSPERERVLMDRLEEGRPSVAIFMDDSIEGPERRLENAAPRVHSYLLTSYEETHRFGRFRVMERRTPVRTEGLPSAPEAP